MRADLFRSSMLVSLVFVIVVVETLTYVVVVIESWGGEILIAILLSLFPYLVWACLVVSHGSGWGMNYHNRLAFVGGVVLSVQPCSLEVSGI